MTLKEIEKKKKDLKLHKMKALFCLSNRQGLNKAGARALDTASEGITIPKTNKTALKKKATVGLNFLALLKTLRCKSVCPVPHSLA